MDHPSDASSTESNEHGERASDDRRWLRRAAWGLGVLGMAALGAAVFVLFTSGGGPGKPRESTKPERTPFAFGPPSIELTPIAGSPKKASVADVAEQIRGRLSEFYDAGFMDPNTWAKGLPPDIWQGFTRDATVKAEAEPESLTLGRQPSLERLSAGDSSLALNILFDAKKRPTAIIAGVRFEAIGELTDGSSFTVGSKAQFLFRPISGRWLIAGFPEAEVKLDSEPPPSPEPSATVGSPEVSP